MKFISIFFILLSINIFSQEKLQANLEFGKYQVFTNSGETDFQIRDRNNRIQYKNLKFVGYINESLQVLDEHLNLVYLDKNLKPIKFPEPQILLVCGTVNSYTYTILDYVFYYNIQSENEYAQTTTIHDRLPKWKVDDVTFLNGEKHLWFDDNSSERTTLLIHLDDKIGLKEFAEDLEDIEYFDEIDATDYRFIKVKKGKLWGFHQLTEPKYKVLENFVFRLAAFQLPNGEKGYLDLDGKEYLK